MLALKNIVPRSLRSTSLASFGIALGLAACAAPAATAPDLDDGAAPLVVGCDLGNAPFAWVEGEVDTAEWGTLAEAWYAPRVGEGRVLGAEGMRALGRDVEMAEALAAKLGRPLVWQRLAFGELLDAVEAGTVDAVIATLGWTAERNERVELVGPYFTTTIEAVVRDVPGAPLVVADLAGLTVSAGAGTTSALAVAEAAPEAVIVPASDKGATGLERLLGGEVEALVMDGPDARDLVALHAGELRLLNEPLTMEFYVIAVDPSDPELSAALEGELIELIQAGALEALDARFGLESIDVQIDKR